MSVGVDLDDLGVPQIVQDLGSVTSDPQADLTNSLPEALIVQDQSNAQIVVALDLQDTVGSIPPNNQDRGPAFLQAILDGGNLSPPLVTPDSITDAWWQMTGFDTVALVKVTWTAHTPLFPPPTQNPVINISAVRLRAFLPESIDH